MGGVPNEGPLVTAKAPPQYNCCYLFSSPCFGAISLGPIPDRLQSKRPASSSSLFARGDKMSSDASIPVDEPIGPSVASTDNVLDPPHIQGRVRAITTELFTVIGWTVAADLWIFRGRGYLALAAFFAIACVLLALSHWFRDEAFVQHRQKTLDQSDGPESRRRWLSRVVIIASVLLGLAILRLGWSGAPLTIFAAVVVLVTLALALSGWLPTLTRVTAALAFLPFFGIDRVGRYNQAHVDTPSNPSPSAWMSVLLPAAALFLFGGIFVMANPDLVETVSQWFSQWSGKFLDFFANISFWEIPFCILAFFVGAGLLRPLVPIVGDPMMRVLGDSRAGFEKANSNKTFELADASPSMLYPAFRNTLIALIGLFTTYLAYEFTTLFKREFPPGFYYAGYAHEGAAWLTIALALATLTLSMIFNVQIQLDARVGRLKWLAWVWSAMNFLLALAVYNRLCIYVGYNGMTRMRTIGFFGVTLVVIGFILVIRKIVKRRSFVWLIQVQLVAMMLAVVIYGLFPVDYVAHRYNAARVAAGYPKPAVMIAVKPIDDEGIFPLLDLVDAEDPYIREGVRAKLAQRQLDIESYSRDTPWHWHRYQYSKTVLYQRLDRNKSKWAKYLDDETARVNTLGQFDAYTMQWY